MVKYLLLLGLFTTGSALATTASCNGKVRNNSLFFFARGSVLRMSNGSGLVKINNRIVAEFEGAHAKVNYFTRTFSIRNNRGDVVEGKLNNVRTGASTLTRMELPGEGIRLSNVPVKCSLD